MSPSDVEQIELAEVAQEATANSGRSAGAAEHAQVHDSWRAVNIVVTGASRGAGSTSLCDAFKHETFRSGSSLEGAKFRNDILVRWAYASIKGQPTRVVLKDLRQTARETPFSAGMYTQADTAVMLIVDLTKADACELAAIRLAHLAKHGAGTVPTLIVGSKAVCADRVVSFSEVQAFAAANKVQYAECDAFDGCGVQEVFTLCTAMAAGLQELYKPAEFDAKVSKTVMHTPAFVGGFLEELRTVGAEKSTSLVARWSLGATE